MKKIILIILILLLAVLAGWYFFSWRNQNINLEKIKSTYPDLTVYVDNVVKAQASFNQNKDDIDNYIVLGLAWKSLADWSRKDDPENYKNYYREALKVYQSGIDKSLRRNTLLMTNAASMAKYLGDYKLAEEYYKEAISIAPGDESYYISLAQLYEYQMKKSKEEVLAVYEEGLKRVLSLAGLTAQKEAYLERNK